MRPTPTKPTVGFGTAVFRLTATFFTARLVAAFLVGTFFAAVFFLARLVAVAFGVARLVVAFFRGALVAVRLMGMMIYTWWFTLVVGKVLSLAGPYRLLVLFQDMRDTFNSDA